MPVFSKINPMVVAHQFPRCLLNVCASRTTFGRVGSPVWNFAYLCNSASSLMCFANWNVFLHFQKRSSIMHRLRCGCTFKRFVGCVKSQRFCDRCQQQWQRSHGKSTKVRNILFDVRSRSNKFPTCSNAPQLLWNSWIQLSLRNESFEQISLNECISGAGHGFYTWQQETSHRQIKWCQYLPIGWNYLDVNFKRGTCWPT
jgi:hypothetical protein